MKFSKQLIFVLAFILAALSQFSLAIAGDIPGYIGQQSFNLTDDSQLNDLSRRAEQAKIDLARADQNKSQYEDQIRSLTQQRDALIARMSDLQRQAEVAKATQASLQAKLDQLNQQPEANKDQITQIQNEIQTQIQSVQDLSRQAGQAKLDLGPVNVRLDQMNHDYQVVLQNYQNAMANLQNAARNRDSYRQNLISAIQNSNSQGARVGLNDGTNDGANLARRLGADIGSRDGYNDGLAQGTADGQNRYYQNGAAQGEIDGSARARVNGQRDGTNAGTIDGNSSAADREGSAAGVKRGDASNAAQVGIDQGKKAGLDRAVRTGAVDGNNKGENETVQKYETGDLNQTTLAGPFAGSFSRRSPDYPGDFNGPSFNPNTFANNDLVRRAYSDGYVDQYRQYTRYEYLRRIDGEYNANYDARFRVAYDQANNASYPDYYNRGRSDGDARAYSRDYPVIRAQAYQVAFNQYDSMPNRSSAEYKDTYKSSELDAYNARFEQIRLANYTKTESDTFLANIAAQTEIYRQRRIGEVTTVYNNNAVLAFVSSEMLDGGINGVAKLDGVFQPGEATLHSITLRNFGFKPASNVSVQLDNGSLVKLPEIPARSLVIVKGAGLSKVGANQAIGSTFKSSLKVVSQLTSNDAVEAQHFDSIGNGVLKSADVKQVRVAYPLSITSLALNSQLLKGVANKLSAGIANNSKRAYTGDLKVEVLVNSQSQVVSKAFSAVSGLQSTAQLTDAEVLVTDDKDIYRDLSFSASISQNGVLLGVLSNNLVTMAKAQFADKAGAPVIVANSDKNLDALLDALQVVGGTEKASVLDLSLASLNAQTLANGLNQKVLLITDDEKGSNTQSLNAFIGKSKSSTFLFIDENNNGLKTALNLAVGQEAQKLFWNDTKVVMFTNPHRATGVEKSSALVQSSLAAFDKDLVLASDLTLSANDLVARMKNEVNRTSFFTPNTAIKMYSFKALSEILCINRAYDKSGNIFTRDKKWAEMIGNDATLFINVLRAATAGDVTEAKLSAILPSISLKDTVSSAMSRADSVSKLMMPKIQNAVNKVLDDTDKGYNKNLKNFNKDLYNKAYDKASIHRPFTIADPEDPNQ